jgi:hypothetical protein
MHVSTNFVTDLRALTETVENAKRTRTIGLPYGAQEHPRLIVGRAC